MAYIKTQWLPREGVNLNRYTKSEETATSVVLTNNPTSITQPGTPFTPENMNHLEQGIVDAVIEANAHTDDRISVMQEQINNEAQTRATAVTNLQNNKQNNLSS